MERLKKYIEDGHSSLLTSNYVNASQFEYACWQQAASHSETFVDQQNGYDSRYTFSAKEKDDETQYSYFGARYYDSDLSVWLSVDPLSDKYPNLSPYNYCMNSPVMLIDPNGMSTENPDEFGINDAGEIVFLQKKDGPHELYKVDNNGNKVDVNNDGEMTEGTDFIVFDKDVIEFSNIVNETTNEYDEPVTAKRTYVLSSDKDWAYQLYHFLANNNSFEFSIVTLAKDNKEAFLLIYSYSSEYVLTQDLICNYFNKKGWSALKSVHNHHDGNFIPSKVPGDEETGRAVRDKNADCKFFIYSKRDKLEHPYLN